MTSNERLLTPREISERLNVHENTVRRWIREGTLPSIKIGRRLYLPESKFNEFCETLLKEVC